MSTGTLKLDDLNHGRHLYLLSTGTELAPLLIIVRDLETHERFEKVVLLHGVHSTSELDYADCLRNTIAE